MICATGLCVIVRERPVVASPLGYGRAMARTLDLAPWAGRWVAVDAANRVRSDASSLAVLLRAIVEADLGEVEVMRAPAPDEPVVYGLG